MRSEAKGKRVGSSSYKARKVKTPPPLTIHKLHKERGDWCREKGQHLRSSRSEIDSEPAGKGVKNRGEQEHVEIRDQCLCPL